MPANTITIRSDDMFTYHFSQIKNHPADNRNVRSTLLPTEYSIMYFHPQRLQGCGRKYKNAQNKLYFLYNGKMIGENNFVSNILK